MSKTAPLFHSAKTQWIEKTRSILTEELKSGRPYVTSDDIWQLNPLPNYLHKNTVGSVFDGRFTTVGFTISKRKEARGRTIRQWGLK